MKIFKKMTLLLLLALGCAGQSQVFCAAAAVVGAADDGAGEDVHVVRPTTDAAQEVINATRLDTRLVFDGNVGPANAFFIDFFRSDRYGAQTPVQIGVAIAAKFREQVGFRNIFGVAVGTEVSFLTTTVSVDDLRKTELFSRCLFPTLSLRLSYPDTTTGNTSLLNMAKWLDSSVGDFYRGCYKKLKSFFDLECVSLIDSCDANSFQALQRLFAINDLDMKKYEINIFNPATNSSVDKSLLEYAIEKGNVYVVRAAIRAGLSVTPEISYKALLECQNKIDEFVRWLGDEDFSDEVKTEARQLLAELRRPRVPRVRGGARDDLGFVGGGAGRGPVRRPVADGEVVERVADAVPAIVLRKISEITPYLNVAVCLVAAQNDQGIASQKWYRILGRYARNCLAAFGVVMASKICGEFIFNVAKDKEYRESSVETAKTLGGFLGLPAIWGLFAGVFKSLFRLRVHLASDEGDACCVDDDDVGYDDGSTHHIFGD